MYTTQNYKFLNMKSIKKTITILIFLLPSFTGFSQTNKDVTITSSGRGKTQENAKQAALRSAIEQAFGAFISSKTEMFNDQIVADQMSSVSSGNIKSYELLNESQLPDSTWGVTIKSIVSVDKLTSFVEAKGVAIEIKGGMFVLNIKQQILNEEGEIKAVNDMVGLLHETMQTSFDYIINAGNPKSLDADNKNWEIPLEATATANKNIDFCANYCMKTLGAVSLSSEEVASYQSLNKAVFPIDVNYNGVAKTFYLRKESSLNALKMFISFWDYYTRSFIVQSGVDKLYGNDVTANIDKKKRSWNENRKRNYTRSFIVESGVDKLYGNDVAENIDEKKRSWNENRKRNKEFLNFLTAGDTAANFTWNDKKTLAQMEKMNEYTIKSSGAVSQIKHGGIVVYEENGHGLVVAIADWGKEMESGPAKTACEELTLNGFSDWRWPTEEELESVFKATRKPAESYWSSAKSGYATRYLMAVRTF